ncbi:uncharacterized protein LOC127290511 [Leptopilina boulardi]|uniref:uncharacterized protein LOC127290511 n=1 Tax=Leptopilina boulardi TaxID=63433 RepID=UPI0021F66466|nr:uncharacterized protein LOC127290511 [Leptopilina boulardi]
MTKTETISLMKKIQQCEEILKDFWDRVDKMQKKLNSRLLTIEDRERLELELEKLQEVLKKNEDILKKLRRKNSQSFMVAASLIFICFLLFGIYSMFFGKI